MPHRVGYSGHGHATERAINHERSSHSVPNMRYLNHTQCNIFGGCVTQNVAMVIYSKPRSGA